MATECPELARLRREVEEANLEARETNLALGQAEEALVEERLAHRCTAALVAAERAARQRAEAVPKALCGDADVTAAAGMLRNLTAYLASLPDRPYGLWYDPINAASHVLDAWGKGGRLPAPRDAMGEMIEEATAQVPAADVPWLIKCLRHLAAELPLAWAFMPEALRKIASHIEAYQAGKAKPAPAPAPPMPSCAICCATGIRLAMRADIQGHEADWLCNRCAEALRAEPAPDGLHTCETCRCASPFLGCSKLGERRPAPCMEWEPKPAPEPPKCAKCGGHPLVNVMPSGLCYECDTEAARVAGLRRDIAERMATGKGCCVQHRDGRQGYVSVHYADTSKVFVRYWAGLTMPCGGGDWPLSDIACVLEPPKGGE